MSDLVARLRSNEPLPVCPYDRRSPDYWTAPNDQPCVVCGGLNDLNAPDLCRGADTRVMKEAADEIERLRKVLEAYEQWEADIIMMNNCWTGPVLQLTDQIYNRMIEIQGLRNAALGRFNYPQD